MLVAAKEIPAQAADASGTRRAALLVKPGAGGTRFSRADANVRRFPAVVHRWRTGADIMTPNPALKRTRRKRRAA